MRIISPSILAADFTRLGDDVRMLNSSQAEWIHFDVMDGEFVPNISFGFPVLEAVRRSTIKVLDVHLMIAKPERYIARFAKAGADLITLHFEATEDIEGCIAECRRANVKVGISIKPATNAEQLLPYIDKIDLALVMSVEPGFGGQTFIPESLDKITTLRKAIDSCNSSCLIEVDGGISSSNASSIYAAGADVLVAGSSVFNADDPQSEIIKLLEA